MATIVAKDPGLAWYLTSTQEGFASNSYFDKNSVSAGGNEAYGYGFHTKPDGTPVQAGDTIDKATADSWGQTIQQNDYTPGIAARINNISPGAWDNMTPQQQAVATDLAYNYGPKSGCLSDTVAAMATGDNELIKEKVAQLNGSSTADRTASRLSMLDGNYDGKAGGGAKTLGANSKNPNAAGSGAGCAGAGLGILGAIAGAGLLGGFGAAINGALGGALNALGGTAFSGALSGIMSSATGALSGISGAISGALGGVTGALTGGISTALNTMTGGAFQALSSIGAGILPSLTGVLPSSITGALSGALGGAINGAVGGLLQPLNGVLQNPLALPNVIQQFAGGGGLQGVINSVATNMVGNAVGGGLTNFVNNIGMASAFSGVANNVIGATAEAAALSFGNSLPGGIGKNFLNNNDIMSFGMTALSRNLPGAASDMLNMGSFATDNLLRLQAPSNVAAQIINAGLGGKIGLTSQLVSAGIAIAGVDNPINDAPVQKILNGITDTNAIGAVSSYFNVGVNLDHLGQLTDLSHMAPTLATTGPSQNFNDLGQHLISLGVSKSKTFNDIGSALSQMDAGIDLNHLSQMSTPMYPGATDKLSQTFGYGGGTIGEITMADFLGTAAGYVHNDTIPHIVNANNLIAARPEGQVLQAQIAVLSQLISGALTIPGTKGVTNVPDQPDIIIMNGTTYYTLDDAVIAQVANIEAQLTVIKNINDPTVQAALQASEAAHAASCAQILKENHMIQTYGMNLFENIPPNPVNAYVFADGLPYYGQQTGYGQIGEYLEKVASDNIYGDAIKGAMRMGRNANALGELGVNIERFKLPHSQYYRDPTSFYMSAYTGPLPIQPQFLIDQVIPQTPQDLYVELRNQTLIDNGYDPATMLPAQADEKYYDLRWISTSPAVLENIGLNMLQEAVNRNILVIGNKCYVVGLDRSQNLFATMDQNGLLLNNNSVFVGTMLSVLNKMLYGDIGTTKYETPFFTDQMVYGMLEMLGQITPNNIDALKQTLLGSVALGGFLDKLRAFFTTILNNTNTAMDRNEINAWGGSGPDGDYTSPKRH